VCSITINDPADNVNLDEKDKNFINKRMINFAKESSKTCRGPLDHAPMKRMAKTSPELNGVLKLTVGRHRVYYTGHHTQCCYNIIYIKAFKRDGVDDDDDKSFQKILLSAKSKNSSRLLK
jgi:hypothetical protein